ncbi:16S rRNA (cytosine(1402)-N(4))-methyltransferase RsmH [Nakamurella sp. YIM 132084]|uniref:Ribosomal RNA small subunit methyltransferase H n=1 Tax=Nakamurella leprariae TaxID=2803911 RepID=A0A938YGM6_9ACTN|nr:16S rRNA (cytosine(1402)-N(4))-methyltransferase RsmH [Nakamurella leprariae]
MAGLHVPVFSARVGTLLAPAFTDRPDPVMVDGTLGMGGHTLALLQAHPQLRVIGIDRDHQALDVARRRLTAAGVADRAVLVHAVYDEIGDVVADHTARGWIPRVGVAGVLFDLGVSSLQLDEVRRGFAYAVDAPLDMRMDRTTGITAADVLNTYSSPELVRVLRQYGEERFAPRIASAVVRARAEQPFTTSARLVELVRASIPAAARRTGGHPAKRTFQALRIEVNDELGALRRAIPGAMDHLSVGGRLVVLSYQSLEDRIVKHAIAPRTESTAPPGLPFDVPGSAPEFGWLIRGSQQPDDAEVTENPRAASARLRAAVRLREAG